MSEILSGGVRADYRALADRVRSNLFLDGPSRKMVRSWIERESPQPIPWTPLAKPLSECRVALVSSAGIARHDQSPFDEELERRDPWWCDQSWRPIPLGTTEDDVRISNLHIDPSFALRDLDCVLPLRRLEELSDKGVVGAAAATHYSFIGSIQEPRRLLTSSSPAMAERMAAEAVDVALLVPV
jgi:D-proline reductase (dithiol) PrdB